MRCKTIFFWIFLHTFPFNTSSSRFFRTLSAQFFFLFFLIFAICRGECIRILQKIFHPPLIFVSMHEFFNCSNVSRSNIHFRCSHIFNFQVSAKIPLIFKISSWQGSNIEAVENERNFKDNKIFDVTNFVSFRISLLIFREVENDPQTWILLSLFFKLMTFDPRLCEQKWKKNVLGKFLFQNYTHSTNTVFSFKLCFRDNDKNCNPWPPISVF